MNSEHFLFAQPTCAKRWTAFQTSIFSKMTALANEKNAVNLAQGFPDFEGPVEVLNFVKKNLETQSHQYAPSAGDMLLRTAISENTFLQYGIKYCPFSEITITAGATEAIYCAVSALVNAGDGVVVIEPCYDSYSQAIAQAGGLALPVRLHAPGTIGNSQWQLDWETLRSYEVARPKLLILNSPHNPTGKMFSEMELAQICDFVVKTGCFVLCDEVYEHLIFDNKEHNSLAQIEKIKHQTMRVSSAAKTFGFTGFKVGWICAHTQLTNSIRLVHQASVFCTPRFLQTSIGNAFEQKDWFREYVKEFKRDYTTKRDFLVAGLKSVGFVVPTTHASYFVMCNYEKIVGEKTDVEAASWFIEQKKVAAIPPSAFYSRPPTHLPWLRFAFCKKQSTLETALANLSL